MAFSTGTFNHKIYRLFTEATDEKKRNDELNTSSFRFMKLSAICIKAGG